jgi:hypothetical protein
MGITGGFGTLIDFVTGRPRRWYMRADGIRRWVISAGGVSYPQIRED